MAGAPVLSVTNGDGVVDESEFVVEIERRNAEHARVLGELATEQARFAAEQARLAHSESEASTAHCETGSG